jgi:hypothetical protein
MPSRRNGSPGAPVLGFFGGREGKGERGRKKEGDSSQFRRRKTRETPKLRRATAPPGPQRVPGGRMRGWSGERKPLKRECQAGAFGRETQERIGRGKPRLGHAAGVRL